MKTLQKISFASILTLLLAAPAVSFASISVSGPPLDTGVTKVEDLLGFVNTIVNILFTLLMILAVLFIILAAYKYLTAGGDPEKVKGAHKSLIYALVAVAVAVLARALIKVVQTFLHAS